jgi:hypothetical protein
VNSIQGLRYSVLFSALVLGCSASMARAETSTFERTYSTNESIELDVRTDSGSIEIRAGNSGQAIVIGRAEPTRGFFNRNADKTAELLRRFEENPPVKFSGSRLQAGHDLDKDFRRYLVISYEIVVPASTRVNSHSDSGSQTISGVSGPLEAGADSGDITLTEIDGPVEADADSGDVMLRAVGGSVKASTDSGSIVAEGIAGAFEAHTDSGSVRLEQVAPGEVIVSTDSGSSDLRGVVGALRVDSDSGDVTVDGRQDGEWSLETDSGSVRISLPVEAAFFFDGRTGSGGITVDHPIVLQGKVSGDRLSGDVRGGGSLLRVRTDSGEIHVK